MISIGDLSRAAGVKVPTIRYYEQMGLIAAPERSEGNQRRYGQAEIERLAFVKHARDLGFAIEAIKELAELGEYPDRTCEEVDQIARRHLIQTQEKMARLGRLERELTRIVSSCDSGKRVSDCHVLKALADHELCEHAH